MDEAYSLILHLVSDNASFNGIVSCPKIEQKQNRHIVIKNECFINYLQVVSILLDCIVYYSLKVLNKHPSFIVISVYK